MCKCEAASSFSRLRVHPKAAAVTIRLCVNTFPADVQWSLHGQAKRSGDMASLLKRTTRWLLSVTAVFEAYAGVFLAIADLRMDAVVACFAGIALIVTALLILTSVLLDATAVMALLQVFTVIYQLILMILIATNLYMGLRDSFVIGLYFSSLFFFVLQSLLLKELIAFSQHRPDYDDVEGSTF